MEDSNQIKIDFLTNFCNLYYSQERHSEAEPLCRELLNIILKQFGSSHPTTAGKYNDLAFLIHKQNRCDEAEILYKQSMEIYQQKSIGFHENMLTTLNSLTSLYHKQERYGDEEHLYLEAITSAKKYLDVDHPNLKTINDMFIFFLIKVLKLNKVTELSDSTITLKMLQKSIDILKQILGEENSTIALLINNLAEFYRIKGYYSLAEPLYIEAIYIAEEHMGQGHPHFQCIWQNVLLFLVEVIKAGRREELSDHPVIRIFEGYANNKHGKSE
jgi:tetratricopeptide (TPR) repeat protein